MKTKIIPEGMLFTITAGEYSDYETITLCRAQKEIDVSALQEEYLLLNEDQRGDLKFNTFAMINWLINHTDYVEELDFSEMHTGDYSTADFSCTPHPPEIFAKGNSLWDGG